LVLLQIAASFDRFCCVRAACHCHSMIFCWSGTHDLLKPYSSDGMAAQLYFTADVSKSKFFGTWDLDLVWDVMQVRIVS
jgi:hypothetical protein